MLPRIPFETFLDRDQYFSGNATSGSAAASFQSRPISHLCTRYPKHRLRTARPARPAFIVFMLRVWYVPAEVTGDGMNEDSRRAFLSRLLAGAGAAVAFGPLPDFSLAHDHAVAQLHAGENKFVFFTPEEARQMEAVCEQIIPSDDGPGAR
jgi:hypothetical protein